jgi:hypothetical protein
MASLAVAFTVRNNATPTGGLQAKAEVLRFGDLPSAADRLRAPVADLRRRAEYFHEIYNDPQFDTLSAGHQQFIRDRLDELNAYLAYFDRLRQSPRPQDVHTEKALREIKEALRTELALPHAEWAATDAGRLHAERLQDADALEAAVKRARNGYLDSAEKADALWTFKGQQTGAGTAGIDWDGWARQVETLLDPNNAAPFLGSAPVPGAASTLTYEATVLRFDEVRNVRNDWEANQRRLQRLLDLSAALGLAPAGDKRPPVLVIPRPFALRQARERARDLSRSYPNYPTDFVLDRVPEAIRPQVRQVARTNYEHLLGPARDAVLDQLRQAGGGAEETRTRWEAVRTWLRDPKELEDWRVLAAALVRLHDPESGDPVTALSEFLGKTSFTLDLARLTLEVSESLGAKPAAGASLAVYHAASAGDKPALSLELSGEGERDAQRRVWTYQFRPAEGQRLTYRPGDSLWVTLPLRDDLAFTWVRCHSLQYQFERIVRPPWLHKKGDDPSTGTLEQRVKLTVTPPDGVPRVPDLLPVVRLERKD